MYFVYIIKSQSHRAFYIGYTNNIGKRIDEHNAGLSPATKRYIPWRLVYLEGYANKEDARDREEKIKQFGKVYSQLKRRTFSLEKVRDKYNVQTSERFYSF